MINSLEFLVEWLGAEHGSEVEKASRGSLSLRAGGTVLTRVIDTIAQTPRDSIRVSLNLLAHWLAENWWRLRWEAIPRETPSLSWRMAHEIGAAGGGVRVALHVVRKRR